MKKKLVFQVLLGVLLLALLVYVVGYREIADSLSHVSPLMILVILLHVLIQVSLSSVNIWLLLHGAKKAVPFGYILRSYSTAWGIGKFMPEGLGELSIVYFLEKRGVPLGEASAIAIIDKFLTLVSLMLFGVIGVWLFFDLPVALRVSLFSAAALIIISLALCSSGVRRLIKRYILRKYSTKFAGFSKSLLYLFSHGKVWLALDLAVTMVRSACASLIVFILFLLFGTNVGWWYILVINSLVTLISMIPVTISGIGTKELSAVYFFSILGVSSASVLAAYILLRTIIFLIAAVLVAFRPVSFLEKHGAHDDEKDE